MAQTTQGQSAQERMDSRNQTGTSQTGQSSQSGTQAQMDTEDRGLKTGSAERFRQTKGADQWLVANLWNKNVYNSAGESIGNLNDLVIDKDGRIAAVVVGVGGFLGLGEKNVAVDYGHLKKDGGITPDRVTINMSKQDLNNAPSFQRQGSGSGGLMGSSDSDRR
ncbi:PRC-barrel domain-containing protein [Rhodomicrobium sp. Az07]|nr:PRC-barrel domain-containing protein [Rhodomicrobium sp. Az07]